MLVHGPSTQVSREGGGGWLGYSARRVWAGETCRMGGVSWPAKEKAASPVAGSLTAVSVTGEVAEGMFGRGVWMSCGGWACAIAFGGKSNPLRIQSLLLRIRFRVPDERIIVCSGRTLDASCLSITRSPRSSSLLLSFPGTLQRWPGLPSREEIIGGRVR